MKVSPLSLIAGTALLLSALAASSAPAPGAKKVTGWLNWRGPNQNGTANDTGLPDKVVLGGENDLWHYDLASGGSPVIANGRLYVLGYRGSGPDLQEVLLCADAETGKKIWDKGFSDFLSDVVYDRYAIGSPTIDPETGNVYVLTSPGLFMCFTADGKKVWEHSMMEEWGRLTFPNNRNGAPFVDGDLVYVRGVTSNWGAEGPAQDRFYCFDKKTGGLVWSGGDGVPPKDNSFGMPVFDWRNGQRVMYAGMGDGHVACFNARTGRPIWGYQISAGGVNASVLVHNGLVIGIHNDENVINSGIGSMVAVKMNGQPQLQEVGAPTLPADSVAWRNELASVSSSPTIAGDRIYETTHIGNVACVDATNGKVLWRKKLAPDQLHASPLYGDGKLYIPMQNGSFYILKPSDSGAEELSSVKLAGRCLGQPIAWHGKIYVTSTEKIYCFGKHGGKDAPAAPEKPWPQAGAPVALQVIPSEVLMYPNEKEHFVVRGIDANGLVTGTYDPKTVKWSSFIPPTAKVRAEMKGQFNAQGELVADAAQIPSAGAFQAEVNGLKGYIRGRVLPAPPIKEDFEKFALDVPHATETDVKFAYPPLPWIGARFKWEIRDVDGNKVLTKTLDNVFFQRATVFLGRPDAKNYTVEADVMSDGNRRIMDTVGVINQRYYIQMLGNAQQLEVSSNQERVKANVPFQWAPKTWYHLKTRVDTNPDGSGFVRAKAWKKGESEPAAWTIEVPHKHAHQSGSPGLFGFAPQGLFRCYIDNISVTPNK